MVGRDMIIHVYMAEAVESYVECARIEDIGR